MEGSTEAGNTRDELLRRARELETDAIRSAEDGPQDSARFEEAARLRQRALGERIYPVRICSSCFRLTGWLDATGLCDRCLRSAQREAAYSHPRGGWVSLRDARRPIDPPPSLPLGPRIAALFGLRRARDRAIAAAWLSRVEPDDTGPIGPEPGYELEVAHRDQVGAADGSGLVIRFTTATHRFVDGAWERLETTRISPSDTLTPTEFSAGLPIEQLAEAWGDYGAEAAAFNRAVWDAESQRREDARRAQIEREHTLREQTGVAELLDEGGAPER